jgi:FtsH-binding integral membrane protein
MAWVGRNDARVTAMPAGRVGFGGAVAAPDVVRAFFQKVYLFMGVGLAVTGVVALLVASSPAALNFVFGNQLVFWGLIIAQLGLVVAFSSLAGRVSSGTAALMFFGYAALTGVTFSSIFIRYTAGSIASTFFITGGMFAAISVFGLVTKRSLDSVGSFAFMGLIGLVIASLVNIFLKSTMLYWLTTFVGVIVFTGLTAYDTAKLKGLAAEAGTGSQLTSWALRGALTLYLDFINLFLLMLRLFGGRRRE